MGEKVVYEPPMGKYVVQEKTEELTYAGGWLWSDVGRYSTLEWAEFKANEIQGDFPVLRARVVERVPDETK